jgi:hypothetical protein
MGYYVLDFTQFGRRDGLGNSSPFDSGRKFDRMAQIGGSGWRGDAAFE